MATAAAWAGVIVAILAVLVALLQDPLRRLVWSPALTVTEDVSPFPVNTPGGSAVHGYVRLKVCASARRPAAEDVEVQLTTCRPAARLGGARDAEQTDFHVPLRWAFTHTDRATVDPGVCRYVDVLELTSAAPEAARLTTFRAPKEGHLLAHRAEPYTIGIAIAGKNLRAKLHDLRVEHRGGWDGERETLRAALSAKVARR